MVGPSPGREIDLAMHAANKEDELKKFVKLWRSKRAFPNTNESPVAYSRTVMTSRIAVVRYPVDFEAIFGARPTGFAEAMAYTKAGAKPVARWTPAHDWIGDTMNITKVVLKKGAQTLVLTRDSIQIMGSGNNYTPLVTLWKNGYCTKRVLDAKVQYVKIDGKFNVNKEIALDTFADELKSVPRSDRGAVKYESELFPALVLKWVEPALTFQIFENGTVLFTGIKDPKDLEVPKSIFKSLFTKYSLNKRAVFYGLYSKVLPRKKTTATNKTLLLASKYNAAKSWNNIRPGYYVRPGTNGAPRFYPWRRMKAAVGGFGGATNMGPMNLAGVRPKVLKAFADAGVPVPAHTRKVLGLTNVPAHKPPSPPPAVPKFSERRAPSWNATRPGHYVRPGPGKQPYWFKVPKGLDAGRKTVIKAYSAAGRNVPAEVRRIFKITGAVGAAEGPVHRIVMGPNKVLRINDRQATRLTIAELLGVARNLGIAQVNRTMKPAELIGWIMAKANGPNRVNAVVNGVKYTVLNNGRIQRNKGTKRSTREWVTFSEAEQNTVAKAVLGPSIYEQFKALNKGERFRVLLGMANAAENAGRRSASVSSSVSTPSINISNLNGANAVRNNLRFYMGNFFKNSDVNAFKAVLPAKQLRPDALERMIRIFAKERRDERRDALIATNYASKIKVPEFVPSNMRNRFKNALLFAATNVNAKGKYPSKTRVKTVMEAWVKAHVTALPSRAAYHKENAETGERILVPAWSPTKLNTRFNVPNRLSPARALPSKKPRAAPKPRKPAANTRMDQKYALPMNDAVANLASAMMRAGLSIGPTNKYNWEGLRRAGISDKFRDTWRKHVAGARSPTSMRREANALPTAAARKKWLMSLHKANRAAFRRATS